MRCDVRVKAEVDACISSAVQAYGQVDILVANAGIVKAAPFLEMSEQDFDDGGLCIGCIFYGRPTGLQGMCVYA